jgi:hypothetical protein
MVGKYILRECAVRPGGNKARREERSQDEAKNCNLGGCHDETSVRILEPFQRKAVLKLLCLC